MDQTTPRKVEEATCSKCGRKSVGIRYGQYLWPEWMLKHTAKPFPPHGPRMHSYDRDECWVCAVKQGEKWHR